MFSVISSVCWYIFAAILFIVGDAESVFIGAFAWIATILGIVMMIYAVFKALNLFKESSEGKINGEII